MPILDFFRRSKAPTPPTPPPEPAKPGMPFDCCTEDWRIRGRIHTTGRMLEALNRREALEIVDPEWAPLDGSTDFQPVPGLKSVDPYDVLVVFASAATMPGRSQDATAAHKRTKDPYDVILEVPPFHVVGTVHLYPGLDPLTLLDHATSLYVAATGGVVLYGEARVGPDEPTTILVNRSYITRVHQVEDARRHQAGLAAATLAAAAAADSTAAGAAPMNAVGDSVTPFPDPAATDPDAVESGPEAASPDGAAVPPADAVPGAEPSAPTPDAPSAGPGGGPADASTTADPAAG
jgi:hypothetical protein